MKVNFQMSLDLIILKLKGELMKKICDGTI
jgi:hypothetical protein